MTKFPLKALLLTITLLISNLALGQSVPAQADSQDDPETRREATRGVALVMDGDLDGGIEVARRLQHEVPDSPLGYVLEADATWWRIYYLSANLIDPDVFDVAQMENTPFDSHFTDINNIAIRKAEARIHLRQDLARSYLYEGYAYALRARMEGLHDRDLPTARAGKKMRTLLLRSVELDPSLIDAYLGLGIYNYFVDTLSSIVKFLSIFIGLPGGNRSEGLRQLELCAEKGEFGKWDAQFYLGKDYSRKSEDQNDKSERWFRELERKFPHNPLWPMLVASLQFRKGLAPKGEQMYREVYQNTAGKNSEVNQAVHKAAGFALERLHPGQQFP